MSYVAPAYNAIAFGTGSAAYTAPAYNLVLFGGAVAPEDEDTQQRLDGSRRGIRWGKLRRLDGSRSLPWGRRPYRDRTLVLPSQDAPQHLARSNRSPWGATTPLQLPQTVVPCSAATPRPGNKIASPWECPPAKQRTVGSGWKQGKIHDHRLVVPWVNRCRYVDFMRTVPWAHPERTDDTVVAPWINSLHYRDVLHRDYWGRELYARVCYRAYEPMAGNALVFDLDVSLSQVGDGNHLAFYFDQYTYDRRCNQQEPSGWRDNYIYVKPATWPVTPKLAVYIIMNSASLIRTSDGSAVEVFSMNVKADIESWCWSFSARIPASSLPLVSPVSEPVEVLATINGYSWLIMIESWSESRSFNRGEYTITGRSTSAELAAPYAPIITGTNSSQLTSVQIAEEQLTNTGWTIDFGEYDSWLVGAGALSYSNTSALKVIQSVAEAIGGRLLTHRQNTQLLVVPRLHSLPWTWSTATPDLSISDYVVRQLSREFLPGISYNSVFVSGEHQGVLCKVSRSGTAGDKAAPMVTDALITDTTPARERGRMVIGRSGNWSRESLALPLTAPADLPGLLEIGMLVGMTEGTEDWRGQVTGVSVSAQWQSGKGIQVAQNIDVERYRGN